jgi:SAM-dependent methyltransferase
MNWDAIDWTALGRLRNDFLSGSAGGRDYWHSESDLASYDATFAQRIGWKWDYVLAELARHGWSPPMGELLDWGCGSGIAGRAFLDHFGAQAVTALRVWDRSAAAIAFAARRARGKYPGLDVNTGSREDDGEHGVTHPTFNLLLSHVLTELTPDQTEALLDLAVRAQCILWVEPGTHAVSRRLIAIRERLRECFNVIAPCTHSAPCGMLAPGNERHWCHHFAVPPREIFTDGNWSRFARLTGIDLRDLPLSFLVLDRRSAPPLPAGAGRVIGHPRLYKAHALLLGCDATGVRERKLQQRTLPAEFRALKKSAGEVLGVWDWAGKEILATKPLPKS